MEAWTNGFINKVPTNFQTCSELLYANKDYDASLLTEQDHREIKERIDRGELKKYEYNWLLEKKQTKSWESFSIDEKQAFNFYNWLCMKNKAKYILEGYQKEVAPKIVKVHAVQLPIKEDNGKGDEIVGYIDLIADIKIGDRVVTAILDHKSSSRPYDWDAPLKSPQLALYKHMKAAEYNATHVGFIVIEKNLAADRIKICNSCNHNGSESRAKTCDNKIDGKRCIGEWNEIKTPRAKFQVLVCEMSDQYENMVIESIDETVDAIEKKVFPKNLSACHDWYGSDCPYLKYCLSSGKNMKGLKENL